VDLHLDDLLAGGGDLTAAEVWSYVTRTLTSGSGVIVDGSIVTVDSASDSYCPVEHFLKRYDRRTVADFVCYDNTDRNDVIAGLATNDVLLTMLRDASGMVEAACLMSRRYTPADLAALTGVTAHLLCRLVADLAMGLLIQFKPNLNVPYPASYQVALDTLERLSRGERIFSTVEHAQAGVVESVVETPRDVDNRNMVTKISDRFFGRRSNRREKNGDG
jgi:hypothetical protein